MYDKSIRLLGTVLVVTFIFVVSCDDDDNRIIDTTPSWVLSTWPGNGAIRVKVDAIVKVVFTDTMNQASINRSTFYLNNRAVPCSVTTDGKSAVLYPQHYLDTGVTYTAVLSEYIVDTEGKRVGNDYVWLFSTSDALVDTSVNPAETGSNVSIGIVRDAYPGHYIHVPITVTVDRPDIFTGVFDLLVAYDAAALTFVEAEQGSFIDACWEYFTYRYGNVGNCGGPCPSGVVRCIGIADIENGPIHPHDSCINLPVDERVELVKTVFYVTNDREFECSLIPIRFLWTDCEDNFFMSADGGTVWLADRVFDYVMDDRFVDITGHEPYGGHWWLGECSDAYQYPVNAFSMFNFINGGCKIICTDSIDKRGDLNMNDIANEIADLVLYSEYFLYGTSVFDIDVETQAGRSDVNGDGYVLTIADMCYLTRIITGDALPFPKLYQFRDEIAVTYSYNIVTASSDVDVGAILFVFDGSATVDLLADGMQLKEDLVDGKTRVLVWSDNTNRIPAGDLAILQVAGDAPLISMEASDYDGSQMVTVLGGL